MDIEQTTNTSDKRAVLKLLVALSIPTVLEQILSTLLQYVDTAMVGQLGEQATAAVSVTTTITWLVNSLSSALGVAVLAMIAKAVGSGDKKRAQGIAGQALLAVIVCGVVIGGISIILSPFIPVWMGAEQAVQKPASRYFLIVSLPMVFRASSTILGRRYELHRIQRRRCSLAWERILSMPYSMSYSFIYAAGALWELRWRRQFPMYFRGLACLSLTGKIRGCGGRGASLPLIRRYCARLW